MEMTSFNPTYTRFQRFSLAVGVPWMQWQGPIGIGMPSVVKKGRVRSAANSEIPLLILPLSFSETSHAPWKLPGMQRTPLQAERSTRSI